MYIDQFLTDHPKIKLPQQMIELCREGERRMSLSRDPVHDHHHLGRLFRYLKTFQRHHSLPINFQVLLPAICWHDVWKGQRQTLNPLKLTYYQIYEGLGSLKIFYQQNRHLEPNLRQQIGYAIRKHSQFQLFPLTTLESKILKDLDDLDVLSAQRLKPLLQKRHQVHPFTKAFGKAFLHFQLSPAIAKAAQFSWTKKRLNKQAALLKKLLKWL